MKARKIRLFLWPGILVVCIVALAVCRRPGEGRRAAPEAVAPWTLTLAAPIDHLDVVAREPMIVEHPDGTLFVGGYGAAFMSGKRTDEATLWKSGDGGATWTRVNVGTEEEGVAGNSDMDLDVAPDGTLYFANLVYDVKGDAGQQISVGVSKDAGATWKWALLSKTRFDDRPWVKVAPDGTAHVIWNDGAGVCHAVSRDGGRTWTELDRIHPQGGSSHLAVGPDGEVAVRVVPISASGMRYDEGVDLIAVSTDGGMTWQKRAAPGIREWNFAPLFFPVPRWVEPLAWDDKGVLYSFWTNLKGIWLARSPDRGVTWTTWRLRECPEVAYYPYLVARGRGELAATWFSGWAGTWGAHAARIDVGEGDAPPRMAEAPEFKPDSWVWEIPKDFPPVRDTAGEYLPVLFLRSGGLAVVSPIQNKRENRVGFSFWKLEERRGGSQQKTEGRSQQIHPLLGHGRGVDHVGIGVRDLEKARRGYEEVLGFKCTENLPSVGDRALIRSIIFFEDETLLEFLSPSRGAPASGDEFREWLEKHEGGMSLALETSSARKAAEYLEGRNFEVTLKAWPRPATEGGTNPPAVRYYSLSSPDTPSGSRQVFSVWIWLVEYVSSPERAAKRAAWREQGLLAHPNTARGLHSVWFAVRDLDASLRNLGEAGLEPGETRAAKSLGAKGREVKAGNGSLLLLQSVDQKGILNTFLQDHEDGSIIGLSIEVSDLDKARSWIEGRSGRRLEPYDGFSGRSIMIPPDMTHGVWLEMFQR